MSLSTLTLHRQVLAKDPSLPRTRYTSTSPIIPGALYLGDHKSILNPISLITNSVTHILSIRQSRAYLHERRLARCIQHEQIFLDDGEDVYLLDAVNFGVAFIEDALMGNGGDGSEAGGAVLVHCQEGRSRSASIVIAFGEF
jgi:hypothetical protein